MPNKVELHLDQPVYTGSVQKLYDVPGHDDLLISETSVGGSVFDVGTIFTIPGSDTARAGFRHLVFRHLQDPAQWVAAESYIRKQVGDHWFQAEPRFTEILASLKRAGAPTHHLGMVDAATGTIHPRDFPAELSNLTLIRKFTVQKPALVRLLDWYYYDYASYRELDGYVVPLEVIVRFGVTSGSSILRKYHGLSEKGRQAYLQELGVGGELAPWQHFETPIIDFTTKYEPEDRNISRQEASLLSGIDSPLFLELNVRALLAAYMVHWIFHRMGLMLWDLKWELATRAGKLFFVDTIDTDSVRATLAVEREGHHYYVHFNKQAMRDYYRTVAAQWVQDVNTAKREAARSGRVFTEILREGQQTGRFAPTPQVDPVFRELQEQKFAFIQRFIREAGTGSRYAEEAQRIAGEEVEFFLTTPGRDLYQELNAID